MGRAFAISTKIFFDTKRVMSASDKATRINLSQFGAFAMTDSRKSLPRRKKASKPGRPPSNVTGLLKRFIFFSYDPIEQSVIIGPAKTNQLFFNSDGQPVKGTVPEALEYGGEIFVFEVERFKNSKTWKRADLRSRRRIAGRRTRLRKVTIKARPYMVPAFNRTKTKLPSLWEGSVKP